MKMIVALVAVLFSSAALAQAEKPPLGNKRLVQHATPKTAKSAKGDAEAKARAAKLQECLEIDDGTKDRLNCYDAVIAPAPRPKATKAKGVADCRFTKEEDERLACYNGFVEKLPKS